MTRGEYLGDLSADGRIILKFISGMTEYTGSTWFVTRYNGGLL
jgi:hypothetical protein